MTKAPKNPEPESGHKAKQILQEDKRAIWGAVKWLCIAFVVVIMVIGVYNTYRIATKPAQIMRNATVKTTDMTSAVMTRLDIKMPSQHRFDEAADSAFSILLNYPVTNSDDMRESLFRKANLLGTEGRVCRFSLDFGNGPQPVYTALDHAAFQTARAVGGLKDRKIRMVIRTPDLSVSFNAVWEDQGWSARWRRTTVKKPVGDIAASARMMDILKAIPSNCKQEASAE